MVLELKPVGRGNWATMTMSIKSARAQPLLVQVGERMTLAGIVWRICRVLP